MGASTPPSAPRIGRMAWRMLVSSPAVISYLISRPTSKKNTAMKMSLMMCASDISPWKAPMPMETSVCQNSRKGPCAGVLATMSAMMAATSMMAAALVEECVNWMS